MGEKFQAFVVSYRFVVIFPPIGESFERLRNVARGAKLASDLALGGRSMSVFSGWAKETTVKFPATIRRDARKNVKIAAGEATAWASHGAVR